MQTLTLTLPFPLCPQEEEVTLQLQHLFLSLRWHIEQTEAARHVLPENKKEVDIIQT
jgi:hypothetical protein